MGDLASLTPADFEGLKGDAFEARLPGSDARYKMALVSVDCHQSRPGFREPFSLTFEGPRSVILPQGIYPLSHPALGELALFVVPVGATDDSVSYEVAFG